MTPIKAVETCFRKYATFKGRAPRSEYWWFALFSFVLIQIVVNTGGGSVEAVVVLVNSAMAIPTAAVTARRLQDTNVPGGPVGVAVLCGWILPLLFPGIFDRLEEGSETTQALIGAAFIICGLGLTLLCCRRGTVGPNRFGDDPLAVDGVAAASTPPNAPPAAP